MPPLTGVTLEVSDTPRAAWTELPSDYSSVAIDPATASASFAAYRERDGETATSSVFVQP